MKDYSSLMERYETLEKQKADIEFYESCIVDKFLNEIKSTTLIEIPFGKDFFVKAWHGDKDAIRLMTDMLQNYFDIKKIDKSCVVGYEMYALNVEFKMNNKNWRLEIPIRQNIERKHLFIDGRHIDWAKGSYALYEKVNDNYSKRVWWGIYLKDCPFCKERE